MSDHIEVLRGLLREAVPYLRDAGEPFEDDGGNEPLELSRRIEDALESDAALAAMGATQHPDDAAVDAFAAAMKAKLAEARAKGRGGWQNKADCPQQRLSDMLRAHVEKGDPRDVANFACFLWNRGEGIAPQQPKAVCTCPSGDGSLRWPCPKHPPQQPEAQEAAVAIPADSVDGELSVEKAINDLCEMHPGADRLAMKLLAALFTHRTVVRYKAGNTAQQPAPVVPEGMVLAEVLRRVAADPDGLLVLARLAKAETGRLRERFAAMLAAAQQPGEG